MRALRVPEFREGVRPQHLGLHERGRVVGPVPEGHGLPEHGLRLELERAVRRGAWLRVFAVTNVVALGVGVFDWVTGYNYLFLRAKPGGDSPFLVGEWPYYLLVLEGLAILFMFVAEQPMRWARSREAQGDELSPGTEPALEPAGS